MQCVPRGSEGDGSGDVDRGLDGGCAGHGYLPADVDVITQDKERVGMTVLNFERSGIDYAAWARAAIDELVEYVNGDESLVSSAKSDPNVRIKLAELSTEVESARLMCYDVAWRQGQGEVPSSEASMSKVAATEANIKVLDYGLEILGMYGAIEPGSEHSELEGRFLKMRMFYTSGPILAGTNEIQKNIIAQ